MLEKKQRACEYNYIFSTGLWQFMVKVIRLLFRAKHDSCESNSILSWDSKLNKNLSPAIFCRKGSGKVFIFSHSL